MKSAKIIGSIFILGCFSNLASAAIAVTDTFDADVGTWQQNTIDTTIAHAAAGGNPGGYLLSTGDLNGGFGAIGAANTSSDYSGVFADGLWNVSVDLNFLEGDYSDARLRFRYQNASFNGWYISLEDTNFDNAWNTYSVTFDTGWSDVEATANGWIQEATSASFAALFDDAYSSEIRLLGNNASGLAAGIDNYKASVVPVPAAVWLFGTALLGLLGLGKRRVSG